jgi:RNA polymerase sigma factor (sigma-70 family)
MQNKDYTDDQLIEMIRANTRQRNFAVRVLLEKEIRQRHLTGFLRNLGAAPEECEEIVNDTLIALVTAVMKDNYQGTHGIRPYLYGAARNLFYRSRRGKKITTTELNPSHTLADSEESVEADIIRGEERAWLLGVISKLTEKCRNILRRAFFEQQTNDEIAQQLGYRSKAVVAVKKSECLKGLAKLLDETPDQT